MAMRQLATRARENSLISPEPSDDTGPLAGWAKLPRQVPPQAVQANLATAHAGVGVAADGGAANGTGDAGATAIAAGDAGAAATSGDAGAHAAPLATDAGAPKTNAPAPGNKAPTPGH